MNSKFYRSQFDSFIARISDEPKALLDERKQAFDWFMKNGFPSRKHEDWQFTDLSAIQKQQYSLIDKNDVKVDQKLISDISIPDTNRIVLVNGDLNNELSDYQNIIIKNVTTRDLRNSKNLTNAFIALNHSMNQGGYIIQIDENFDSTRSIHIINYFTDAQKSVQFNQSNKITINKNTSAQVIEEFIVEGEDFLHNNVTDIDLEENSNLDYIILQDNGSKSLGINHYFIDQADDSIFNSQIITKNGALIRNEVDIQINGQNCNTSIHGLGLLDGKDHIENYTNVIHSQPHCNSQQLYKYILRDSAEGVFNGLVKVQPNAQQTDSQQTNRNILLSKKALMNSNPQLEIYADDVKCSHGSATGELDDDAIFYLRSRGLDIETAKTLLIEGFVKEIIARIKNVNFKERVNTILQKWLMN